jgi:tetratricopeptide (TPR) repeat protein
MAAVGPDDPAPGVCPPRTYQRLAGSAYLALGRYAEARVALTEAALRHEPGKVLAVVLGHLARACLGEGDTDAALRHLRAAIELAEMTQSVGALAVAFRAGREIMRAAGDGAPPEAMEIVEQLLTVVAA